MFRALGKLFFKNTASQEKCDTRSRPPAPEQTIEQAATMVDIMGRLAEGALQEKNARTVLP
jgi:hypothetical protein